MAKKRTAIRITIFCIIILVLGFVLIGILSEPKYKYGSDSEYKKIKIDIFSDSWVKTNYVVKNTEAITSKDPIYYFQGIAQGQLDHEPRRHETKFYSISNMDDREWVYVEDDVFWQINNDEGEIYRSAQSTASPLYDWTPIMLSGKGRQCAQKETIKHIWSCIVEENLVDKEMHDTLRVANGNRIRVEFEQNDEMCFEFVIYRLESDDEHCYMNMAEQSDNYEFYRIDSNCFDWFFEE